MGKVTTLTMSGNEMPSGRANTATSQQVPWGFIKSEVPYAEAALMGPRADMQVFPGDVNGIASTAGSFNLPIAMPSGTTLVASAMAGGAAARARARAVRAPATRSKKSGSASSPKKKAPKRPKAVKPRAK